MQADAVEMILVCYAGEAIRVLTAFRPQDIGSHGFGLIETAHDSLVAQLLGAFHVKSFDFWHGQRHARVLHVVVEVLAHADGTNESLLLQLLPQLVDVVQVLLEVVVRLAVDVVVVQRLLQNQILVVLVLERALVNVEYHILRHLIDVVRRAERVTLVVQHRVDFVARTLVID
jgi:hypothetical protein